jgi:hypothetical protein
MNAIKQGDGGSRDGANRRRFRMVKGQSDFVRTCIVRPGDLADRQDARRAGCLIRVTLIETPP